MGRDALNYSFVIVEVDRDYRRVTDYFIKQFPSLEEAKKWAHSESWSGYDYHAYSYPEWYGKPEKLRKG